MTSPASSELTVGAIPGSSRQAWKLATRWNSRARQASSSFRAAFFASRSRCGHALRLPIARVYLRLLQAVSQPELDWNSIEELIKSDATIYYRFMRFVNSAGVGIRCEVRSVRQALGLLGDDEIRRWCRLAGMFEMSKGQPGELLLSALGPSAGLQNCSANASSTTRPTYFSSGC